MGPVRIVRHTSECDVEPITGPIPYILAIARLRHLFRTHPRADFDLVSIDTGRYVSWAI